MKTLQVSSEAVYRLNFNCLEIPQDLQTYQSFLINSN